MWLGPSTKPTSPVPDVHEAIPEKLYRRSCMPSLPIVGVYHGLGFVSWYFLRSTDRELAIDTTICMAWDGAGLASSVSACVSQCASSVTRVGSAEIILT